MNIALATYCILSGLLLIYDWFKIRKLEKARLDLRERFVVNRTIAKTFENLLFEVLRIIREIENDPTCGVRVTQILDARAKELLEKKETNEE